MTLTTNNYLALSVSSLIDLPGADASASLEGGARVASALVDIVLLVSDALEVLGPDGQGTGTTRFSREVMTGVLDNEPDVLLLCKLDSSLDLLYMRQKNMPGMMEIHLEYRVRGGRAGGFEGD